jgi:Tol biopolymer transport system component
MKATPPLDHPALRLLTAAGGLAVMLACGANAPQVVRLTDFERGTLFGLERVTHDDNATEDSAQVCGDQLAYDTNKDGNYEIYLKPVLGREITRKTTSAATDWSPSATADCSRIAFVSNREGSNIIYVIAGREASAALRVGPGDAPNMAPDGSVLFYQRFLPGEGTDSIWRFDFTTNQHTQLVAGFHPAVSPDGGSLAYCKMNEATGYSAIWILDLKSQQEQQVATKESAGLVLPIWSADSKRLLMTVNRGRVGSRQATPELPGFAGADLAVVGRDGTGYAVLTDNPANDIGRAWDKDGFVYFTSHREKSQDIWRFNPKLL